MKSIIFEWKNDGANHQVCTTYEEIIEFIEMNNGKKFTVRVWNE